MKKLIAYCFLFSLTLFAGVIRNEQLSAKSDGSNIIISWSSADENGVASYIVERRQGSVGEFIAINNTNPRGSYSDYQYIDQSAFKTSGSIYQYQIKAVKTSGEVEYSKIVQVAHQVSSVKRTWGSLKAMFR